MKGECIDKGRGLRNMKKRADMLGAKITLQSDDSGVKVRLSFAPMCEPGRCKEARREQLGREKVGCEHVSVA